MDWQHLLAYMTGTVDQELLLRHAYLVTENRILRNQITGRVRLSDGERQTLAESGQKLGKHALEDVAKIVTPDTMLAWHPGSWSPKSLMAPSSARLQGVPRAIRSWRPWSCVWPKSIAPGATTGSPAPWPTLGTPSVTRPWGTS
jgi:hypothetical protein